MNKTSKIYVAGHSGLVGSAVLKKLQEEGYKYIITALHKHLDLRNKGEVEQFIGSAKPDYVIICAGTVGGIVANNTRRAEFIYDNTMIQTNIIHSSYEYGVKKLLAIGSSCIYPRNAPQPIKEEYLLTGELEPTNEPYAVAKISAIKMCESYRRQYGCNFITAIPCNSYGEHDNYDTVNSHVLPALIKNFHDAKINMKPHVIIWGSGTPYREFIHSDDMADAIFFLMQNYDGEKPVNVGVGKDLTIQELAMMVKDVVGYTGEVYNDLSKPDGMKRKLLDVTSINSLGWTAKIGLREGIERVYKNYIK
jgi:GDP-L-fucose synthase